MAVNSGGKLGLDTGALYDYCHVEYRSGNRASDSTNASLDMGVMVVRWRGFCRGS